MRNLAVLAALLLFTFTIAAADLAGSWKIVVDTPNGQYESIIELKQDGDKLTGTLHNDHFGDSQLSGTVKANEVTITQKVMFGGQEVLMLYTGKIDSATAMSGTFKFGDEAEGEWAATKK